MYLASNLPKANADSTPKAFFAAVEFILNLREYAESDLFFLRLRTQIFGRQPQAGALYFQPYRQLQWARLHFLSK